MVFIRDFPEGVGGISNDGGSAFVGDGGTTFFRDGGTKV